MFKILFLKLA